jgi:CheY-like chemotaxis protein
LTYGSGQVTFALFPLTKGQPLARKILLADDSVTAQNMGRRILTDAGYEVTTVNNGSAALKKIAEQLPELIVLDVYMPGYSGLEVCQRLKETRETARIPVLLTVGKLEPFKPEEARRARADAFIVKPFEASELLTALTKLEDKIVPQPTGQKGGQFAKAWAELEQGASGKTEKFGDSETGWKDRLIIPKGGPKEKVEEPEPEEIQPAKNSKGSKKDEKKDAKVVEIKAAAETIAGGVPADITPEEVAAIAAAAAAFEEKANPTPAEFAVKKTEVPEEAALTSRLVSTTEPGESKPAEVKAESEPTKETPAAAQTEAPVEAKAPEATPVIEKPGEETTDTKSTILSEVAPAAASSENAPAVPDGPQVVEVVSVAVAAEVATPGSVKWVAQEVALVENESSIILEQEMQKAYAMLRAATSEADFSVASAVMDRPGIVTQVEAKVEEVTKVEEVPAAKVQEVAKLAEPAKIEEVKVVDASKVGEVAEIETRAPEPAPGEGRTEETSAPPVEPQPETVTAVAAAASAGSTLSEIGVPEASAQSVAAASAETPAPISDAKPAEAELAAAWAQWKQIRESVVGPQLTSQIADVAAAELKKEKEAEPERASSEAQAQENPAAIANIVDSVLAELKPKLLEEIAKKLGKDKK